MAVKYLKVDTESGLLVDADSDQIAAGTRVIRVELLNGDLHIINPNAEAGGSFRITDSGVLEVYGFESNKPVRTYGSFAYAQWAEHARPRGTQVW